MSLIRQRKKNMIIAGIVGALLAIVVVGGVYIFFEAPSLEAIFIEREEKPEPKRTGVYTVIEPKKPGEVIEEADIMEVLVEEAFLVENVITDSNKIIGKRSAISIQNMNIITEDMIQIHTVKSVNDIVEINEVLIPVNLELGEYVDVRIHYPTGQDYAVLQNKEIMQINEERTYVCLILSNDEIIKYSSAKVDKKVYEGTEIYLTVKEYVADKGEIKPEQNAFPANANTLDLLTIEEKEKKKIKEERIELEASLDEFFDADEKRFKDAKIEEETKVGNNEETGEETKVKISEEDKGENSKETKGEKKEKSREKVGITRKEEEENKTEKQGINQMETANEEEGNKSAKGGF